MENYIPKNDLLKGFYLYAEDGKIKEEVLKFLYEKMTRRTLYYFQLNVKFNTRYTGKCTIDISFSLDGYYDCLEHRYPRHEAIIELETVRHYLCDLIELGFVVSKKTWKKRTLKDFNAKCRITDFVSDLQNILRNIDR